MYTVYTIWNQKRDRFYIGHTENLEIRLQRHNGTLPNRATSFTSRNSGKWLLIYKEEYATRKEAIAREKQLKGYRGRQLIRNLIENRKKESVYAWGR